MLWIKFLLEIVEKFSIFEAICLYIVVFEKDSLSKKSYLLKGLIKLNVSSLLPFASP